jgi:hypothetical protein
MSDPRRLLTNGSDFERNLLRSAYIDAPSSGARRRTLVALGLGIGATVSSTTAASTGVAMLVKWLGVGAIAGLIAVGAADKSGLVSFSAPAATPAMATPVVVSQPVDKPQAKVDEKVDAPKPSEELAEKTEKIEAPQVNAQVNAVADAPAHKLDKPADKAGVSAKPDAKPDTKPDAPVKADAKPDPVTALSAEVALLDQAHRALSSGNPGKTLELLAQHDKDFRGGPLSIESVVLRIEALAARGDRAGAAGAANAFLASYPRSAHANRVRSVLASVTGGTASP